MASHTREVLFVAAGVALFGGIYYLVQQRKADKEKAIRDKVNKTNNNLVSEAPDLDLSVSVLDKELFNLAKEFDYDVVTLNRICDNFVKELKEGLGPDSKSSLAMIPTFVTRLPSGTEKGTAYALDIGGSNLRVLKVSLDGKGGLVVDDKEQVKLAIPVEKQVGSGEALFDFIAEAVGQLVKSEGKEDLGFTFSFPIDQTTINSGLLIKWTKNFVAEGVVGKDVCDLLNKAFERKKVKGHVNALINDTVGTLLSGCYQFVNTDCCIGLILGTGTNTCYYEQISNIKKIPADKYKDSHMVINMESGNFGSRPGRIGQDLPLTEYDMAIDRESNNVGQQLFEKQISGMYLGEILRQILRKQMDAGNLFKNSTDKLKEKTLTTADMSDIDSDSTKDLSGVAAVLARENIGIINTTLDERNFVKQAAHLVAKRAAALSSVSISGILRHLGKDKSPVVVAIDGSVFEKYPDFHDNMKHGLFSLLGHNEVRLELAKDGSGIGAALASFTVKGK